MFKSWKTWLVAGIIFLSCLVPVVLYMRNYKEVTAVTAIELKSNETKLANDLIGRWVVIPPNNNIWTFSSDQNIRLTVLDHKSTENMSVMTVKLLASTVIVNQPLQIEAAVSPIPGVGNPVPISPKAAMLQELNGIVRLHYELIGKDWMLIEIKSINLK